MQPVSAFEKSYDPRTIRLHWLTAILVVLQWVGAETFDYWPKGPLRVDVQSLHITGGIILTVLILARILWRVTGGRQLPAADRGLMQFAGKAVHWLLYLLILSVVGLGLAMLSLHSMNYFNLFMLPHLFDAARTVSRNVHELHELLAHGIMIVALGHAGAALVHHHLLRDGVLARMIPRLAR